MPSPVSDSSRVDRALHRHFPATERSVPFAELGRFPTAVQRLQELERQVGAKNELWIKRDDQTSPHYGGNKVRTLEVVFADALARHAPWIYATGAFGSNHAAATVLHARRVGLSPRALLFPQPPSPAALENLRITLAHADEVRELSHWSTLPLGMAGVLTTQRRAAIMLPGAATPLGALGYVSAAFELAEQIAEGALPAPDEVFIAVGSTCTSAGLLLGFALAARHGIGFLRPPRLVSVRVTPWPVTSPSRIVGLAVETGALLERLTGAPVPSRRTLARQLVVDGRFLGPGYGYTTTSGLDAIARVELAGGPRLDTGYSGKSGAAWLDRARQGRSKRILFWATKSSAPIPPLPSLESAATDPHVGRRMRAFLRDGMRFAPSR